MPQIQQLRYTALRDSGPLRVAAYCRVSSDSEDQLNSYAAQIAFYTEYIGQRPDWELVDIYADEGLTGTKTEKRDDLKRLINDCRRGKIDKVIVKSVSRFARNTYDSIYLTRQLKSYGTGVYFEEQNIDTADMNDETMLAMQSITEKFVLTFYRFVLVRLKRAVCGSHNRKRRFQFVRSVRDKLTLFFPRQFYRFHRTVCQE